MMPAPSGKTPISKRRRLSGSSGVMVLPCSAAICWMRCQISSRASAWSANGRPSAAAVAWRVWSSGVAPMPPQLTTRSPLANASRSRAVSSSRSSPRYWAQASCMPRWPSSSMNLARWESCRLPDRISSPTMNRPTCMPSNLQDHGGLGHRFVRAPCLQGGHRVVGEPGGREREHECVEPDRHQHQEGRQRHHHRAEGPDQRRRRTEVAAHHAHDQHRQSVLLQQRTPLFSGRMLGQHIKAEDLVGQPAPDQRRQHHHQRRDQPQRHRQHDQHQRQRGGGQRRAQALQQASAALLLEQRKAPLSDKAHDGRRHAQGHQQQAEQDDDRQHGCEHDDDGQRTAEGLQPDTVQPLQQALDEMPALQRGPNAGIGVLPEKEHEAEGEQARGQQRQQRQRDHPRHQAIGGGAPEGVGETLHQPDLPNAAARRLRPSHCCRQKPWP
mmetsp:Transcript_36595/g.84865  ORF Transcript_36595/g.84865 Transcript_36595/m.84865 type:complete len:440 (-) Transcript_36595:2827-4146(-)